MRAEEAGQDCAACGAGNPAAARFCGACGQRLASSPARAPELRPLTLMFCDIVGASALAAAVDPEDYAAAIAVFLGVTEKAVSRFGGTVTRYAGDGVMCHFGFPAAREDDAERAVHAALAIQADMEGVEGPDGQPMRARIGIAAGLVLVSDITRSGDPRDLGAYGEAPNLAHRLQTLAAPGAVVISASMHDALGGLFETRALGSHAVKGWLEPVPVWQVLAAARDVSRFEARRGGDLLPMLGRDAALARLRVLWKAAEAGRGDAVLISGEAGIGKSRLVAQLLAEIPRERQLRYFAAPYQRDAPLQPAIQQIEHDAGIAPDDPPATKLAKLRGLMPPTVDPLDFALVADLLLIPPASLPPVPAMGPAQRRERLLGALLAMLEAAAQQSARLLVFEDAHWSDPLTLDLAARVVRRLPDLPLLLLITSRTDGTPQLTSLPQVETIALDGLDAEQGVALIRHVARDVPLPADSVRAILARADGVPLFIEELTRAVVEAIAHAAPRAARRETERANVPISLHASLLERLDRLGPAREVAEAASIIGRRFDAAILARTMGRDAATLRPMLDRLVEAGIVLRREDEAGVQRFRFRHALLQDAASSVMPRPRYRALHAAVADVLESDFPALAVAEPQLLATHRAEAGQAENAARWWLRSAQLAMRRSAVKEALTLLDRGFAQLRTLPDADARVTLELELEVLAGQALLVTQGHAAPETRAAFARARLLCARAPSSPFVMVAMHGQWTNALLRGEMALAEARAEELRVMGDARQVPEWQCTGWRAVGITAYIAGDFQRCVTALDRFLGLYDRPRHQLLGSLTVHDPEISGRCYRSWGLLWLGRSGEARAEALAALAAAQAIGHPYTVAHAIFTLAKIEQMRGADAAARQRVEETLALSESGNVPFFEHVARIFLGAAIGRGGDPQAGLALVRAGIAWHRATECWAYLPGFLAIEGELMALAGETDAALTRFEEAFARVDLSGARWDLPELHRQHALVQQRAGRMAEAEAALRRGHALAEAFPLRRLHTALSLAAFLDTTGRAAEGHALLAAALEGHDEREAPILHHARLQLSEPC
jgi:class 3 adenylate cyclase/predicted ATPase